MTYAGSALEGELSMTSAAKVLGVDRHTVSRWVHRREVFQRWRRTPNGRVRIPVSEVRRVKAERTKVHDAAAVPEQQQAAKLLAQLV